MFCWQVNGNPVRLYWRVRVLNVCSGHVLSFPLTWRREALRTLHDRASMVIIKCVVRGDALFLIFGVQRSRFRIAAVVDPNLPLHFLFSWSAFCLFTFGFFVCLDFIFKRESPAVMFAQVQMVLRFDSNGLLWFFFHSFFLDEYRVQHNSAVWQTSRPRLRFTHMFLPGFSKVINFRLCRIGKETFSAKTSFGHRTPVLFFWRLFLYRIFRYREGRGFVLNLCSGFSTSFCVLLQSSYMEVFTGFCSNFLWKVVGGLGSSPPSVEREPYEEAKTRGTVRLRTSAITFLMPDQERVSNDEPEEDGCAKT